LLRISGPRVDFLGIADRLPDWMLGSLAEPAWPESDAPLETLGFQPLANYTADSTAPSLTTNHTPSVVDPFAARSSGDDGKPTDSNSRSSANELASLVASEASVWPPLVEPGANEPASLESESGPNSAQPPIGPRHFTPRGIGELANSLAMVETALGCPSCASRGFIEHTVITGVREVDGQSVESTATRQAACDDCKGSGIANMTTDAYERLCQLADVVTFVEVDPSEPQVSELRERAIHLLARIGAERNKTPIVGRLAGQRLDDARRAGNGILLAGTVQQIEQEGNLFRTQLVLFGVPRVVQVMSWRPPEPTIGAHDRVLILGSIVENPRENLAGYDGALPQIVWGGLPHPIRDVP